MTVNGPMSKRTARIRAQDMSTDAAELRAARTFLEGYATAVHMLRLCREDRRERERLARDAHLDLTFYGTIGGNEAFWMDRTREVRDFINALPYHSCKMLLFYHYIRGLTVERCAEELDISPRSAFRLKKKALAVAARALANKAGKL